MIRTLRRLVDQASNSKRARWAAGLPYRLEREIYMRRLGVRGRGMPSAALRRISAGIHRARYEALTAGNLTRTPII